MRDRLTVTISGYRGARHFTLNQLMRRVLVGAGAGLGVVLMTGLLIIAGLSDRVGGMKANLAELRNQKTEMQSDNEHLLSEQGRLRQSVALKSRELNELAGEIEAIEVMIGLKPAPVQALNQRLDTARQTAFEKRLMLESIPSGQPLRDTRVTSRYGNRMHPVHKARKFHWGVDLRASHGTPIYATADGVVEIAGRQVSSGMGNMVKLGHNYGFSTIYGHMKSVAVASGAYVQRGELLGYSGATGTADGPHLHYEVRYLNQRLNPAPFMDWSLENYSDLFTREERVQWESLAEMVKRTANVTATAITAATEPPSSPAGPALTVTSP